MQGYIGIKKVQVFNIVWDTFDGGKLQRLKGYIGLYQYMGSGFPKLGSSFGCFISWVYKVTCYVLQPHLTFQLRPLTMVPWLILRDSSKERELLSVLVLSRGH